MRYGIVSVSVDYLESKAVNARPRPQRVPKGVVHAVAVGADWTACELPKDGFAAFDELDFENSSLIPHKCRRCIEVVEQD